MHQTLHLLIVHASSGTALSSSWQRRWFLPVIACGERVRADPIARRWTEARGVACEVVGQWLGRVCAEVTDWLMVLDAEAPNGPTDPQLTWTPLKTLLSRVPAIEYQGWALEASVRGGELPERPGPFGRFGWNAAVTEWIGAAVGAPPGGIQQFRTTPHEVVLGANTPAGHVYFKGLSGQRVDEARLTATLSGLAPEQFAPTLRMEERADGSVWWLTGACPGRPANDPQSVARALAQVQQRVAACGRPSELRRLDLEAPLAWASGLASDGHLIDALQACARSVREADVPASWIPMDLDPGNALIDADGCVRFIDLDESFFGPAPLGMAIFAARCKGIFRPEPYENAWSPPLAGIDWRAFDCVARVVEVWLGWNRLLNNAERGEIHCRPDLLRARVCDRLQRLVHRR